MIIIGDRHYRASAGESVTFQLGASSHVGSVAASVNNGPGGALPITVVGSGHNKVVVTVGFTGSQDGSADILISGSAVSSSTDDSRIRQLTRLSFRSGIFIID